MDETVTYDSVPTLVDWRPTGRLAFIAQPDYQRLLCELWRDEKSGNMQWKRVRMVDANLDQIYHYGFQFVEFS